MSWWIALPVGNGKVCLPSLGKTSIVSYCIYGMDAVDNGITTSCFMVENVTVHYLCVSMIMYQYITFALIYLCGKWESCSYAFILTSYAVGDIGYSLFQCSVFFFSNANCKANRPMHGRHCCTLRGFFCMFNHVCFAYVWLRLSMALDFSSSDLPTVVLMFSTQLGKWFLFLFCWIQGQGWGVHDQHNIGFVGSHLVLSMENVWRVHQLNRVERDPLLSRGFFFLLAFFSIFGRDKQFSEKLYNAIKFIDWIAGVLQ